MVQSLPARPASDDPLAFLRELQRFGIKLGLDNMRTLKAALGDPDRCFRSILIAGTNGKGSVAAMVERGLRAAGYSTGLYTSPHLIDLNERFALNGRPVDDAALAIEAASVRDAIERLLRSGRLAHPPTFFEATTALALSLFRRRAVDVAVLEVGMGGRFDATNTVGAVAAGIPSIDLDHQQYLGATLGEIAFEKAGVIKPGTVVVSAEDKPEARDVLRRQAAAVGARFVDAGEDVAIRSHEDAGAMQVEALDTPRARYGPLTLALRGRHQLRNAAVAVRLMEELEPAGIRIPSAAIEQALANVRWRGRIELVDCAPGRRLLLDPAHNPAAAAALRDWVRRAYPSGLPFVFGALADKDAAGMLAALGDAASRIVCVPIDSPRARPVTDLVAAARDGGRGVPVVSAASPAAGLRAAWRTAPVAGVTGSMYLVGEVLHALDRGRLDPQTERARE
jgi:dihydrofolate synthase/folylpolyglutamate synthase